MLAAAADVLKILVELLAQVALVVVALVLKELQMERRALLTVAVAVAGVDIVVLLLALAVPASSSCVTPMALQSPTLVAVLHSPLQPMVNIK